MAKPSINIQLDALMVILRVLQKHNALSTTEIQQCLLNEGIEIERRTMQRYLKIVETRFDRELKISKRGKENVYQWDVSPFGELDPLLALTLQLTSDYFDSFLPRRYRERMNGHLANADQLLEQDGSVDVERLRRFRKKIVRGNVSQQLLPAEMSEGVLEAVTESLMHNKILNISYRKSGASSEKEYRVKPLGLAAIGVRMYLVCEPVSSKPPFTMTLALHRIQGCKVSMESFEPPDDFSLSAYVGEGRCEAGGTNERVCLTLDVSEQLAGLLNETPLAEDQSIEIKEEEAGVSVVTATVMNTGSLDFWIRGWGDDIYSSSKTKIRY